MSGDETPRDTASLSVWHVLRGTGLFDVGFDHPNRDGWQIYEAGQKKFWPVEDAVDWAQPFDEEPEVARAAGAMLAFLCPGEKAAITGASLISTRVRSEEAKLYFVEQAIEEAKHYEALRRLVPKLTGEEFPRPNVWVRALYSYGVIDPDDLPFMMGNINVVGEHIANSVFRKIRPRVRDPKTIKLLSLIGQDESRHIAAGNRFYGQECGPYLARNATRIARKNATTAVLLLLASHRLVGPMRTLDIDLCQVMSSMYQHYDEVTGTHRGFAGAFLTALLRVLDKLTPRVIDALGAIEDDEGRFDFERFSGLVERLVRSPRALARLVA
jgi:rubrerythrin